MGSRINDTSIPALIDALMQNHDGFRQMAMRRLLNYGPEAVPVLIHLLADRRAQVQESAAIILTTMGKSVVPDLIDAIRTNKDPKVCWGAAWVLATLGPEAYRALKKTNGQLGAAFSAPTGETSISNYPGVWSDSWITKVRQKLEASRGEVSNLLAACAPA